MVGHFLSSVSTVLLYRFLPDRAFKKLMLRTNNYLVSWCFEPSQPPWITLGIGHTINKLTFLIDTNSTAILTVTHHLYHECRHLKCQCNHSKRKDISFLVLWTLSGTYNDLYWPYSSLLTQPDNPISLANFILGRFWVFKIQVGTLVVCCVCEHSTAAKQPWCLKTKVSHRQTAKGSRNTRTRKQNKQKIWSQ